MYCCCGYGIYMETEYIINGRPRKTWWYRLYLERLCFKSFWTSHKTAPISSHNYIRQWSIWFRGVDQGQWARTPRIRCLIYLWLKKHIHEKIWQISNIEGVSEPVYQFPEQNSVAVISERRICHSWPKNTKIYDLFILSDEIVGIYPPKKDVVK